MYDNEFETRNIKFKPIMKLNHNIYIILAVVIDSDQTRISLRASSPIWASLARTRERGAEETKLVTQTKRVPAWPVKSINFVFRNVIFQPMVFPFV